MTFQTESVKKSLEECKALWDKGYITDNMLTADIETVQQMFIQGKLGHLLIAPDKLEYLMNNAPDTMELGTCVLPGIAGLPPDPWEVQALSLRPAQIQSTPKRL